jgi:aryl-alcohol dehydrogenase-like predicted oxidoreductase
MNVFFDAPSMLGVVERHGLLSINRSPLAMGVLGGELGGASPLPANDIRRNTFDWMDYFKEGQVVPEITRQLGAVRELLRTGGRSLAQGAIGWLWAKSPSTLPIPGFRSAKHADDTITALEFGPLPEATMAAIERVIERAPEGPFRER